MSVPCMVITRPGADAASEAQQTIEFGKKSVPQMLDLLGA
jgi:thioredoxin reductase (NADPH)